MRNNSGVIEAPEEGVEMPTYIKGNQVIVDGLAPTGSGSNSPTVDNLTVNNNIYVSGYKDSGISFLIPANSSKSFTPKTQAPYLVFYNISDSAGALYVITGSSKRRLAGEDIDVRVTVSNYTVTLENPVGWSVPVYILAQ